MKRDFKNLFTPLILLTLFTSCNVPLAPLENCVMPGEVAQLQQKASDENEVQPKVCAIPEREESANLELNVHLTDFAPEKEQKMQDALERIRLVINSKEFKQRVLDHEYNGVKTFYDNGGMNNEEVYNAIMAGNEVLVPGDDEEMDLNVTLYFKNNGTVGYTYPNKNQIWVNDKFFANFTLGKVAANVVHEWTHKLGFEHDFNRTTQRNFSVPYGVGTIIQELVDGM